MHTDDIIVAGSAAAGLMAPRPDFISFHDIHDDTISSSTAPIAHDTFIISNHRRNLSPGLQARRPQDANTSSQKGSGLVTTVVVVDVETTVFRTAPATAQVTSAASSSARSSPSIANASVTVSPVASASTPVITSALASTLTTAFSFGLSSNSSPSSAASPSSSSSARSSSRSVSSSASTQHTTSSSSPTSSAAAIAAGSAGKAKFPTAAVAVVVSLITLFILILAGFLIWRRKRALRSESAVGAYKASEGSHFGTQSETSLVRDHISPPILGPVAYGHAPMGQEGHGFIPDTPYAPPPVPAGTSRMHPGTRIDGTNSSVHDSSPRSYAMNASVIAGAAATAAAVAGFKINRSDAPHKTGSGLSPTHTPSRQPSTWLDSATPSENSNNASPYNTPPTTSHNIEPPLDSAMPVRNLSGPRPLQWRPKPSPYGASPLVQQRNASAPMSPTTTDPDAINNAATGTGAPQRATRIEDFYAPWVREMMDSGQHSVGRIDEEEGDTLGPHGGMGRQGAGDTRWSRGGWRN